MARKANENTNAPDDTDVRAAVRNIEELGEELARLRGVYMLSCRRVHEKKTAEYDAAGNRGISKKLLKMIDKERVYERKVDALGAAAVARADGKATLAGVGA